MRKTLKYVVILVLVLALLTTSGCQGGFFGTRRQAALQPTAEPGETHAPDALNMPQGMGEARERSPQPVSALVYEAPDLEALEKALDDLYTDIAARRGGVVALLDRYREVLSMYNEADAALQLAYLMYARDVTNEDYWNEYADLEAALLELDLRMTEVSVALFDMSDETNRQAREMLGDGYVNAVYEEESLNSEEVIDLLIADNDLQFTYDQLLTTFTFLHNGKAWTLDEIMASDDLNYDEYIMLYDSYCEALNAEAGALFIEMLGLREQIASKLGFGSYAAYRYACYGRDYSIVEAQAFHELVKTYIVPIFVEANLRAYYDVYDLYSAKYEQKAFMDRFTSVLADNPAAAEALRFMQDNELADTAASDKKMESSFTTYVSSLATPYIFTQWADDSRSVGTILHEFGHFMSYYYNPETGWSSGDSLDLAEIDSQGFTLLMTPYYNELYGEDYAALARTEHLLDALYAIVTGCMEDEFQQRVYANPGMTLEQMNRLYAQLATAYGMEEVYGFSGMEWVLIPHSFQSPMYYISYAVSMVAALQLWEEQQTSEAEAWEAYWGIMMRGSYSDFRSVLMDNGLSDPLSETTIKRIAALIDRSIP